MSKAETAHEPVDPAFSTNFACILNAEGLPALRENVLMGQVDLANSAVLNEMIVWFGGCDAASRAQAVNALMALALDLSPILACLLSHPDPHLRLLGISLLEFRRDPDVEDQLLAVVERDLDVRVCGAALDLLCEVGTETSIGPLERLKVRFATEAYIQFAATLAVKRIREN